MVIMSPLNNIQLFFFLFMVLTMIYHLYDSHTKDYKLKYDAHLPSIDLKIKN